MALEYTRPPESLAIELREVARDANAVIDALNRGFNYPLPREFPKDQLIDICKSLVQLPDGTAEGCRAPLDYARHRLPAIRREYILSEELSARTESGPALTRGENLDVKLGTLISSVTTALDEYRRLAAEDVTAEGRPEASVISTEDTIADATVESSRLDSNIAGAQEIIGAVVRPESEPADDLKRQLGDARGLNRLAFAEIRMPRVVVSWLRKSIDALKEYPGLIKKAAHGLRIGTDIIGIGLERWHEIERDLGRFVVDQMHRTWDALDEVADVLETRRRKGSGPIQPPDEFDLDIVRALILEGKVPPKSWWPFINELDFFGAGGRLENLAPVSKLINLQSLNLWGTKVRDLAALGGLINLRRLDLSNTSVSDVAVLGKLTNLHNLDLWGTKVTDVAALETLTNLEQLDLSFTSLSDVTALGRLTNLRDLDLSDTLLSDVTTLGRLTNLQRLNLSYTQVNDVAKLAGLKNLQSLNLRGTPVKNVALLKDISGLKILGKRTKKISKQRKKPDPHKKGSASTPKK